MLLRQQWVFRDACSVFAAGSSASESKATTAGLAAVFGVVVLFLLLTALYFKYRSWKVEHAPTNFEAELEELQALGLVAKDIPAKSCRPRELNRSWLVMDKKLGNGAFGEVWKGVLDELSAGGVPGYVEQYRAVGGCHLVPFSSPAS